MTRWSTATSTLSARPISSAVCCRARSPPRRRVWRGSRCSPPGDASSNRTLELYLALAAKRREQLTAVVIAAVPLDETQRHRLAAALQGIYGKPVQLQLVIDEKVVGGIRVQIGDEVVDGTILSKLEGARRHFAG